jgi:hypothetical protein
MFSAMLFQKDIYGLTKLQAVYIIQTTLPLYISSGWTAKLLLDFKSLHIEKGYTVLAAIVCTENNEDWDGNSRAVNPQNPRQNKVLLKLCP